MTSDTLRIGLATPRPATTREGVVAQAGRFLAEATGKGVQVVCFPETYLPGYRGPDFPDTPQPDQAAQERDLRAIQDLAREQSVAVILPAEWEGPDGLLNVAFVIDRDGSIQGMQSKNQIPFEEEPYYVHGCDRRLFEVDGVPFGIAICHEGSRYPETVRWAASRGAKVVFHPHLTGSDVRGNVPRFWGDPEAEYYEKATVARAVENAIYFASVNFAFRYPESATSVISPEGKCIAHVPYGEEALLVVDLDLRQATAWPALRYAPERYGEAE
jgi:predicted amidohydrolase